MTQQRLPTEQQLRERLRERLTSGEMTREQASQVIQSWKARSSGTPTPPPESNGGRLDMEPVTGPKAAVGPGPARETTEPPPRRARQPEQGASDDISGMDRVNYLAGGFNKGVLDIADFPVMVTNMGLNAVGVPERFQSQMPSDYFNFRDNMTRVPESVENADTPFMDSARTGLEWGAGAAIPSRMAYKIPDALAAGGAMLGEQIGGETGEMIGGLAGGFSPLGFKGAQAGIEAAGDGVRRMRGQAPRQEAETEAVLRFLRGNVREQDLMDARSAAADALARGEEGSLSDLTRSPGLSKVEGRAFNQSEGLREDLLPRYQQFEDQSRANLDNIAPNGIEFDPVQPFRERVGEARRRIPTNRDASIARARQADEAVQTQAEQARLAAEQSDAQVRARREAADQAALEADQAVGGTGRTDRSSAALSQEYDRYNRQLRETLDGPAWARFDEATQMDVADIKAGVNEYAEQMPEAMRADLFQKFNGVMRNVQNMADTADPKDVQYVLSAIKDINRTAANSGDFGTLNKKLSEISGIVDNAMRQSPEVGESFREAIRATVRRRGLLGDDWLEKARRAEPELFADTANFKGNKGAVTIQRIADSDDPAIMAATEDYLRDVFRNEGISERTLIDYAPALDKFPGLRNQVQRAVDAGETAISARQAEQASSTALKRSLSDIRARQSQSTTAASQRESAARSQAKGRAAAVPKMLASKYAAKPDEFIQKRLASPDDTGELGQVFRRVQRDGPESVEAFKSNVLKNLEEDIIGTDRIDILSSKGGRAIQAKLDRLVANGILDTDDMQAVSDVIARQEGRRLRKAGGQVQSAKNEAQAVDDAISTMATLPILSALPSSHQLMAAGMIKRNIRNFLQDRRADPAIMARLESMIKSPELFIRAMDGKITAQSTPREMDAAIKGAMRAIANVTPDMAQENEE